MSLSTKNLYTLSRRYQKVTNFCTCNQLIFKQFTTLHRYIAG